MKVYHLPDLDGLTEAIVAAARIEEAARALGISTKIARERGWKAIKGSGAASARRQPGTPLYRSIIGGAGTWTPDHAEARGRAARAAVRDRRA